MSLESFYFSMEALMGQKTPYRSSNKSEKYLSMDKIIFQRFLSEMIFSIRKFDRIKFQVKLRNQEIV